MTKITLFNEQEGIKLESESLEGRISEGSICGECLRNIIVKVKNLKTPMLGNLVKLKDDKDNFRSFSDILEDIKRIYNTTKEEQQDKILEQMVGKENMNKFKAIFENGYIFEE